MAERRQRWRARARRHRLLLAGGLVLIMVAAGTGTWLLRRGGDTATAATTTATVATQTETQTVAASGTLAAASSADDDFAVSGTVTAVLVAEGDRVQRHQVLARVDDTSLVAARQAALATYDAAVSKHTVDLDAGADDTQLAADATAVVSARDGLTAARADVRDAVLRASMSGTVTAVDVAVGDVVGGSGSGTGSAGSTSATGSTGSTGVTTTADTGSTSTSDTSGVSIVSTNRFELDATVAATDVKQVKAGLQATITATGVDGNVYGTVASVGAVAQTDDSGAAVFPVVIDVTGTRTDVYAGTSADATITVKQTPDVLVVPTQALHGTGTSTYVEKVVDGRQVKTAVTTGTVYGATTEVTKGLTSGDVVVLPTFTRTPGSGSSGGTQQQGGFPGGGTGGPPAGGFPGGTGGGQ